MCIPMDFLPRFGRKFADTPFLVYLIFRISGIRYKSLIEVAYLCITFLFSYYASLYLDLAELLISQTKENHEQRTKLLVSIM